MTRTARQELGAAGERLARQHLERLGYQFVAANWRDPAGELDLVMRDGETVVFVEVKTRRGERLGAAEEALGPTQSARLLRAAQRFLASRPELANRIWRVDLFAVTLGPRGKVDRMTHIPNAIESA